MLSAPQYSARRRQQRQRVLDALELRIKQFVRREELWPLRIPREPLLIDDIIDQTLQENARGFDPAVLRSRPLLRLEWEDGSAWDAWVIVLPSGFKLYCDSTAEETRVLASGGRNEGDESDRVFLELLAESAGRHFGIEMAGGAPIRVRSAIAERDFLVELFVNLFEVAGTEDSIRDQLGAHRRRGSRSEPSDGSDFRREVEQWLEKATA